MDNAFIIVTTEKQSRLALEPRCIRIFSAFDAETNQKANKMAAGSCNRPRRQWQGWLA